jgi:hypothetical protein
MDIPLPIWENFQIWRLAVTPKGQTELQTPRGVPGRVSTPAFLWTERCGKTF